MRKMKNKNPRGNKQWLGEEEDVSIKNIYLFILVFFGFLISFRFNQVNNDFSKFFTLSENDTQYISNVLFSVGTSILAALLFSYFYKIKSNRSIREIKEMCEIGLVNEWLSEIARFKGRYRRQENLKIILSKHTKTDKLIFICQANYDYHCKLLTPKIQISFYRYTDEKHLSEYTNSSDELLTNEFYWAMNEADFPSDSVTQEDYCLIGSILCNGQQIDCERKTREKEDSQEIVYKCQIPDNISLEEEVHLMYEVQFPVEKEDILFFTHEFPTLKATIEFDYRDIGEDINVFPLPVTGVTPPSPHGNGNEKKIYIKKFSHEGWLYPKQGFVFAWWLKGNKKNE